MRRSVCQAIDHERKGICGFSAGCIDFFLSRRIVPGLCFLGAVERDYDKSLGWGSIKTRNFIGPDDELAAGTGHRCRRFIDNASLEAVGVSNFQKGDNNISWRL